MSRLSKTILMLLIFTMVFISSMTVVTESNSKSVGAVAFSLNTKSSMGLHVASVSLGVYIVKDDGDLPGNGPLNNAGLGPLDNPGEIPAPLNAVFCPNSCA